MTTESLILLALLVAGLGIVSVIGSLANILYVRRKHRFLNERLAVVEQLIWNAPNIVHVLSPVSPLPRPGDWAVSQDFIVELLRNIGERRPSLVVELGSGLSTIVIALQLKRMGRGRVVSIDHDADYAERIRVALRAHGVEEFTEVRVAPLKLEASLTRNIPWYDVHAFDGLDNIDFLVVDGPPMPVHAEIRYPALPFFRHRLHSDWMLILDDADREGERAVLERWEREFPDIKIRKLPLEKGAALVTPRRGEPPTARHAARREREVTAEGS